MQKLLLLFVALLTNTALFAQQSNVFSPAHLRAITYKHKLNINDFTDYTISDNSVSKKSGVRHVYLQQQHKSIPVYQAIVGVHISPDGTLLHSTSRFVANVHEKINTTQPVISPEAALQAAAADLGVTLTDLKLKEAGLFNGAGISDKDIPYTLRYQIMPDGNVRLGWNFIIDETRNADWWDLRVDAVTSEVLDKTNWTVSCDFGTPEHGDGNHTHVHNTSCSKQVVNDCREASAQNPDSYNVIPLGVESLNHGSRQLVVDPADLVASPYAWHDTNGSTGAEYSYTRGNNVYAYEDGNADNSPGYSPDGGASLDFDFPFDATSSPTNSLDAIITNLFYWNNIVHDVFYQYGFDEVSGNFQENNYGRGGAGSDFVNAEAQDGSGTNNANFSTPADGSNPRMQMFIWSGGTNSTFLVNSPGNIAANYNAVVGSFGPASFNVTGDLVVVDDGSAAPAEACNALTNGGAISGNIAVIDRGSCQFGVKALNAQNAGAIAVIVCNNVAGDAFAMAPGTAGTSVTIPSVMISQADCATIRVEIPTVNVTITSTGTVNTDSDMDNGIIAHEYGHGISTRLTGGPNNSGCLGTSEQMGEGWSDWFGLMLTMDANDTPEQPRGVGSYVLAQSTTGSGIRTHRYSTDFAINPHTYNDIGSEAIPHGVGSVWCAMIWDMTWALIDVYGFDPDFYNGTGGNNIAMDLVIEGLKLQGCSPGFIDGRDGILAADEALYGGANQCLIWSAFARRGLGFGASQGSTNSTTDGTESYDIPSSCTLGFEKTADKATASAGDTITYTLTVNNSSASDISNLVIADDIPENTTYVNGSASNGGLFNGTAVSFPATTIAAGATLTFTFSVVVNGGAYIPPYTTLEDAESVTEDWISEASAPDLGLWEITTTNPYAGTGVWFAPDVASPDEQYLTSADAISPTASTVLQFWHSYDTEETWDGGLVQISTNNQASWSDLGPFFTQNGYTSTIDQNAGTPAFSGNSGGYVQSIIDLSSFADQEVYIRFWMHCDPAVGGVGWYVDNIEITDRNVIIPNTASLTADGGFDGSATLAVSTRLVPCTNCEECNDGILNGDEIAIDCGGSLCPPCIEGCTDSLAHNYDAAAQVDNGTCETCTDGLLNGDEVAIDCGGVLCVPCIEGCTDSLAHNYDATAQVDNGTCETCSDGLLNGDEVAIDCGGVLCVPCIEGCTDSLAHNYDATAQVDNGSCETCSDGLLNGDEVATDCGGILCVPCTEGCTDSLAHNYDATAQVDNGTCETCSDGLLNGDEIAIDCGGVLCVPCIEGCTDTLAHNYDPAAQVDNGTCETCDDGLLNGDEAGVDCGGTLCASCPPPCADILVFVQGFNGNVVEYRANIQIQSTADVMGNSNVNFVAGDNVEMNPDFSVELGSEFYAGIGDCNGASVLPRLAANEALTDAAFIALREDPFAEKVSVEFNLPEGMPVAIRLYDVAGVTVQVWQEEAYFASGINALAFDTAVLPAGVYQVVMEIGGRRVVSKLLID